MKFSVDLFALLGEPVNNTYNMIQVQHNTIQYDTIHIYIINHRVNSL